MFDHWIYKNNFRFKNIASTDDEQIDFYLNHYSVGCLTMYFYVFGRLLTFKHIKMHKFTNFFCHLILFHLIYLLEVLLKFYNKYFNN